MKQKTFIIVFVVFLSVALNVYLVHQRNAEREIENAGRGSADPLGILSPTGGSGSASNPTGGSGSTANPTGGSGNPASGPAAQGSKGAGPGSNSPVSRLNSDATEQGPPHGSPERHVHRRGKGIF